MIGRCLTLDGLKLLKAYQRQDVEALAGAPSGQSSSSARSRGAMRDFLRHALERDARSLAFLDEIREAPSAAASAAPVPASAPIA